MTDASDEKQPEWLVALRDPILGHLRLSPYIGAPEYIPDVLEAFGKQHPPARRWIVVALDEMATKLWFARNHKAPLKFAAADEHLEQLENAVVRLLTLWSKTSPYYEALLKASMLMVPPKYRRLRKFNFSDMNPGPSLGMLLPVVRALRSQDIYSRAFSQPSSSRMSLERALLWEPMFDLLHQFNIEEFDKYQPLINTISALHFAAGIEPPDPGAVRQAHRDWRQQHPAR